MREEYAVNYDKPAVLESVEMSLIQISGVLSHLASNSLKFVQGNGSVLLFVNFSIGPSSITTLSEINEYLNRLVDNIQDSLKWWTDNSRVYPNLSSMALDYLVESYKAYI